MGALSRTKGHQWERDVATMLRSSFPDATVRRSDQGFGAYEPDVVIEGNASPLLKSLWIECQCSRKPTPLDKLCQAERDAKAIWRVPVCIWRMHGARTGYATMRLGRVFAMHNAQGLSGLTALAPVTMPLASFLAMLSDAPGCRLSLPIPGTQGSEEGQ